MASSSRRIESYCDVAGVHCRECLQPARGGAVHAGCAAWFCPVRMADVPAPIAPVPTGRRVPAAKLAAVFVVLAFVAYGALIALAAYGHR